MGNITKLVVIDDDSDLTALLKVKLEKTGRFEVFVTNNPTAAVTLARRETPDLILLDIDMPKKSGGEVAADLRTCPQTADIPVLFLSGMVKPEDVQASGGIVGGRQMASKKTTILALVARIDALVAKGRKEIGHAS